MQQALIVRWRTAALALVGLGLGVVLVLARGGTPFYDAVAYYVIDLDALYEFAHVSMIAYGAFRYAPPVAQVLDPLGALPLEVFLAGWTFLLVGALAVIGGRRFILLLGVPFVVLEVHAGNVHLLLAAAVVLGFRWPAAWALLALTKVTPFVGVLWFALRGEWGKFAIAGGTTLAIVVASAVLAPQLWVEWLGLLAASAGQPTAGLAGPVWLRLAFAMLLLAWAAPRDERWALPVVVLLAMPNIWWHSLAILAASVALYPTAETSRGRMAAAPAS